MSIYNGDAAAGGMMVMTTMMATTPMIAIKMINDVDYDGDYGDFDDDDDDYGDFDDDDDDGYGDFDDDDVDFIESLFSGFSIIKHYL